MKLVKEKQKHLFHENKVGKTWRKIIINTLIVSKLRKMHKKTRKIKFNNKNTKSSQKYRDRKKKNQHNMRNLL